MKAKLLFIILFVSLFLVSTVMADDYVQISPANPIAHQDLTCNIFGVDPNSYSNYVFNWFVNGQRDNSLVTHIYPGERVDRGERITCLVTTLFLNVIGSDTVNIGSSNIVPTVQIVQPTDGSNILVNFNTEFIALVQDEDVDGLLYLWDFGDGFTSTLQQPNHFYSVSGTYTVTLTVTDNEGLTGSDSAVVYVQNRLDFDLRPVVNILAIDRALVDELVLFNSITYDPDGGDLSLEWDFGDGTTLTNNAMPYHTYTNSGRYTVTLTVQDDEGNRASDTHLITITDPNAGIGDPTAIIDSVNLGYLGFAVDFSGANSFDSDGNIVDYSWNFDDGFNGNGVSISHEFLALGNYFVTLTVTDNDGNTNTATRLIRVREFNRGIDIDKQRIHPSTKDAELRDFRINRVMPLTYKTSYARGEEIPLLIKVTNEGSFDENVDLLLRIPELNYVHVVPNMPLDIGQVDWLMVNFRVPSDALSCAYVLRLTATPNTGEYKESAYFVFNVA